MAQDKKKKSGGLLNDIAMGLGLKDRDESYYARTAQTIQNQQGGNSGANYYNKMVRNIDGNHYFPKRGGLFAFMSGGNSGGGSTNTAMDGFAKMMGYRDRYDMTDRGGRYASGGMYEDGGLASFVANLGHIGAGKEFGNRQAYSPLDEMIKSLEAQDPQRKEAILKALMQAGAM